MDSREYRTSVTEGVGREWVGTSWFSFNFAINLKTPSPYLEQRLRAMLKGRAQEQNRMWTSTQPTRTAAEKEKPEMSKNQAPSSPRLFNGDGKVLIRNMKERTVSSIWKGPEQGEKAVDQTWPAKAG